MVALEQVTVALAPDDPVDDRADVRMTIGDDVAHAIPGLLADDRQVAAAHARFHAVPVNDDVGGAAPQLRGSEHQPRANHERQRQD